MIDNRIGGCFNSLQTLEELKIVNKKFSYRFLIIVIFAFLLAIGSGLIFVASWESRTSIRTPIETQTEFKYFLNGTILVQESTTLVVENYFPFRARTYNPELKKTFPNGTQVYISNDAESLKKENITIKVMEYSVKYGEQELFPPLKEVNPPIFISIGTVGLSKNIISVKWSYQINETLLDGRPAVSYSLGFRSILSEDGFSVYNLIKQFFLFEPINEPFFDIVFYLFFIGAGFAFSWIFFRNKSDLYTAYNYLTTEFKPELIEYSHPVKEKKILSSLSKNLRILAYSTNNLNAKGLGILFGLSILLFKISINTWFKKHHNTCLLHEIEPFEKELEKYAKNLDTKISNLIPQSRTITIAIAFLASVGISFKWNVGAAVPFLYSLGLFYVFLNLGSTLYLVRKSKKDIIWVIVAILLIFLVVFSPEILFRIRWS